MKDLSKELDKKSKSNSNCRNRSQNQENNLNLNDTVESNNLSTPENELKCLYEKDKVVISLNYLKLNEKFENLRLKGVFDFLLYVDKKKVNRIYESIDK